LKNSTEQIVKLKKELQLVVQAKMANA
jgi:hypothetical protein